MNTRSLYRTIPVSYNKIRLLFFNNFIKTYVKRYWKKKAIFLHALLVSSGKWTKSKSNDVWAFLSSHGKVAINFAVWKHCFESFTYSITGICWKNFVCQGQCPNNFSTNSISRHSNSARHAGSCLVAWRKKRVDGSGAPYPFKSILMAFSTHMVPYCFFTHIREHDFFCNTSCNRKQVHHCHIFYPGRILFNSSFINQLLLKYVLNILPTLDIMLILNLF